METFLKNIFIFIETIHVVSFISEIVLVQVKSEILKDFYIGAPRTPLFFASYVKQYTILTRFKDKRMEILTHSLYLFFQYR